MDINLHTFFFYLIAILTSICAIGVVVTRNIVRSAAWLLFTLAGTAGIFFLLNADFVGATQLLIYVGGTLVLVVFGVMLTAQGPFITMKTGAFEWGFSTFVGQLLDVKEATPDANLTGMPKDRPVPPRTKMGYLLPFEIVSVHLLVVLIGAA